MQPTHEQRHRLAPEAYRGMVTVAFTACVADRQPVFHDPIVVGNCLALLRATAASVACVVPIYCFMPDHLHLIIRGTTGRADTRQAMIGFKQRTGFWMKGHGSPGRWQKDFYDHVIRADEDLGAQVRYIAGNPVRRGLVSDWRDYPHTGSIGMDLESVIGSTITL